MGIGKSSRSKNFLEKLRAQQDLELETDIVKLFQTYPELDKMKFTNFQYDYLHYIVLINNNKLLKSWVKHSPSRSKISESVTKSGNKLIHTAIDWQNIFAAQLILSISKDNCKKEK